MRLGFALEMNRAESKNLRIHSMLAWMTHKYMHERWVGGLAVFRMCDNDDDHDYDDENGKRVRCSSSDDNFILNSCCTTFICFNTYSTQYSEACDIF